MGAYRGAEVYRIVLLVRCTNIDATAYGAKPTFGSAPAALEFDLLREPKRIIYFHAEIANSGLDLCVPEQQLYRP